MPNIVRDSPMEVEIKFISPHGIPITSARTPVVLSDRNIMAKEQYFEVDALVGEQVRLPPPLFFFERGKRVNLAVHTFPLVWHFVCC